MINYHNSMEKISSFQLQGLFVGWPNPPNKDTFFKLLNGSYKFVIATDGDKIIGFINAISDGVLTAYIPLLEVLPEYQGQGIGKKLVNTMIDELSNLYMIDLLCDKELVPYYEKIGMHKAQGVCIRNYDKQSGAENNLN